MASRSIVIDDGNLCGEAPLWDASPAEALLDRLPRMHKFYAYDWKSERKEVLSG